MKPVLKAPETTRLKLKCDDLPSNFAFKFNLRRYNEEDHHFYSVNYHHFGEPKARAYTRSR